MSVLPLEEIKVYLRYEVSDTSNDVTLARLLAAGETWVERYTGQLFERRQVEESFAHFPPVAFDLHRYPYVADSLTISYLDASHSAVDDFADWSIREAHGSQRIIPTGAWPKGALGVTLTYTAGYETIADIPDDLIHAVCVYCAMSDQERASPDSNGWACLEAILAPYRMPVVA